MSQRTYVRRTSGRAAPAHPPPSQRDDDDDEEEQAPRKRARSRVPQPSQSQSQQYSQNDEDDDQQDGDDDDFVSPSQVAAKFEITEQEKELLVGQVMRYAICQDTKKLPLRRDEMNKLIFANYNKKRGLPNEIINLAKERLRTVFGFDMVEIQKAEKVGAPLSQAASLTQRGTSKKKKEVAPPQPQMWILILAGNIATEREALEERSKEMQRDSDAAYIELVVVIVTLIHLNDGPLKEEQLWHFLKELGIKRDEQHPKFGNIERTLDRLIKECYLSREKDTDSDVVDEARRMWKYNIGARTKAEMEIDNINRYVAEISASGPPRGGGGANNR
eukprot:GEZU01020816.1.p1 GENE.GEZU01020816.1~~GEZU01020816.1.p1  ORF type:complete len:332 (-),score=92.27 GEZU01020816.1:366-1361(-)